VENKNPNRLWKLLFECYARGHFPNNTLVAPSCFRPCNITTTMKYRQRHARFSTSCCQWRLILAPCWRLQQLLYVARCEHPNHLYLNKFYLYEVFIDYTRHLSLFSYKYNLLNYYARPIVYLTFILYFLLWYMA